MISDEFTEQEQKLIQIEKATSKSTILTEEVFSLLEERLRVDLSRRKIGEIVVRKEIETHVLQVQVPIRREKLIVEQISPEYQRLAEIDLGQIDPAEQDLISADERHQPISMRFDRTEQTVYGEVESPKTVSNLFNEIANLRMDDCQTIRIELVLKDPKYQNTYRELFARYCQP